MTTATAKDRPRIEPGYDMVDGVRVERDMGYESDSVGANFIGVLHPHVRQGRLGHIGGPNGGFQYPELDGGQLKFPDVSFIAAERMPAGRPKGWANIPPDFVVEVVSPNDEADEVHQKVGQWLASGVRLVWVVYPEAREVVAHHPDRHSQTYGPGETLSGEDVIPGFRVAVAELFESP